MPRIVVARLNLTQTPHGRIIQSAESPSTGRSWLLHRAKSAFTEVHQHQLGYLKGLRESHAQVGEPVK